MRTTVLGGKVVVFVPVHGSSSQVCWMTLSNKLEVDSLLRGQCTNDVIREGDGVNQNLTKEREILVDLVPMVPIGTDWEVDKKSSKFSRHHL